MLSMISRYLCTLKICTCIFRCVATMRRPLMKSQTCTRYRHYRLLHFDHPCTYIHILCTAPPDSGGHSNERNCWYFSVCVLFDPPPNSCHALDFFFLIFFLLRYSRVFSTSGTFWSSPLSSSSGTTQPLSSSYLLMCWPPPLCGRAGFGHSSIGVASSRMISASVIGLETATGGRPSSIDIGVCDRKHDVRAGDDTSLRQTGSQEESS